MIVEGDIHISSCYRVEDLLDCSRETEERFRGEVTDDIENIRFNNIKTKAQLEDVVFTNHVTIMKKMEFMNSKLKELIKGPAVRCQNKRTIIGMAEVAWDRYNALDASIAVMGVDSLIAALEKSNNLLIQAQSFHRIQYMTIVQQLTIKIYHDSREGDTDQRTSQMTEKGTLFHQEQKDTHIKRAKASSFMLSNCMNNLNTLPKSLSALQSAETDLDTVYKRYDKNANEYIDFLSRSRDSEAQNELESYWVIMTDVKNKYSMLMDKIQFAKESIETKSVKSHTSQRSDRTRSSASGSRTVGLRAKAESEKIKLKYVEKEVALKKEQFEKSLQLEILEQQKNAAAADVEATYLERHSQGGSEHDGSDILPKEEIGAFERTLNYLDGLGSTSPQDKPLSAEAKLFVPAVSPDYFQKDITASTPIVQNIVHTIPKQTTTAKPTMPVQGPTTLISASHNSAAAETQFTTFLIKKNLLLESFQQQRFDDKPDRYIVWKKQFKVMAADIQCSALEEITLLTNCVKKDSDAYRLIMSTRASCADSPDLCLTNIWNRLDQRFGSAELLESALKTKLSNLPNMIDRKVLYDLHDLLNEIQAVKTLREYSVIFSYLDSSLGIRPIVQKLPKFIQDKWITRVVNYKKQNQVIFPPFSEFLKFIGEISVIRNDPSLLFETPMNQSTRKPSYSKPQNTMYKQKDQHLITANKMEVNSTPVTKSNSNSTHACLIHIGAKHTINECKAFRSKSLENRKTLLRSHNICLRCCDTSDHFANRCRAQIQCDICKASTHCTALHIDFNNNNADINNNSNQRTGNAAPKHGEETPAENFIIDNGRPTSLKPCEQIINVRKTFIRSEQPQLTKYNIFETTSHDNKPGLSIEDRKFLDIMDKEFRLDFDGKWVAPLPFGSPHYTMPDNYLLALNRAKSLDASLHRNETKKQHLLEFMQKIIDNHHAEIAPYLPPDRERWYLPLFGVYHPRKPEQIRGVFDASAKFNNVSLNDQLLQGPDLINSLLGILIRFRKEMVGVVADIQQMFHSFLVQEEHRDFLRFLWHKDNVIENPLVTYRMRVHVFGNRPSPSIAMYGLRRIGELATESHGDDVKNFINNDFYVDDGLKSCPSSQDAIDLILKTQEAMKMHGNLRLHKFASNSKVVMNALEPGDLAKGLVDMDFEKDSPTQRSLGLLWDLGSDTFKFSISNETKSATRRGILSVVNSLYDPMGFISPITVQGKIILRKIVSSTFDWDDPLPEHLLTEWNKWSQNLPDLEDLRIPRIIVPNLSNAVNKELFIYCDASELAIAAVCYLHVSYSDGSTSTGFVLGKAKVAPAKCTTIPRLELCSAVLGVEIAQIAVDHLQINIDNIKYFSDSRVVLGYINNEKRRFFVYVANRVARIRSYSEPTQWLYVRSEKNPADIGTRGIHPADLQNSLWLHGPSRIEAPNVSLDKDSDFSLIQPDVDVEIRSNKVDIENVKPNGLGNSVFEKFSDWNRLNFALATVRKFIRRHLNLKRSDGSKNMDNVELLHNTEQLVLREVQQQFYESELNDIRDSKPLNKHKKNVSLGDVVLVRDKELSRNSWPLGIVTKVMPSDDGLVRKVELRMIIDGNPKTFLRPISEVVLLVEQ
ncbi:unnamed protein product [Mytilus edulis]|uniref:DUF5641 domain-containing protein n=1 Tax=Mytilus edulis TaxID=6550 RepID=A0A8S3THM4_MYTED|nr:unnamed protein product [Mytilus edulis]